jgi:subtilisin family serine protease
MKSGSVTAGFAAAALLCGVASAAQPFATDLQRLHASDEGKLHSVLRALEVNAVAAPFSATGVTGVPSLSERLSRLGLADGGGLVSVNVVARDDGNVLRAQLQSLGVTNARAFGSLVSGRVPLSALRAIAALPGVQSVRPAFARTNAGLVTTQGDRAQGSANARATYGVDGSGIRVGILSDSFKCLTAPIFPGQMFTMMRQDIRNDDLPPTVKILADNACSGSNDEGRAMGQIVHDVAPGASIAFHTAFAGEADFAQGIIDLANAGSNVIVDDVVYFDEPMFQDGILAQAANAVHDRGVAYFSAAGNDARASYEGAFRLSGSVGASGVRNNFAPQGKPDPMQTITLTDQGLELIVLNWDEPFRSAGPKGSRSDLDLIFYRMNGTPVPICDNNLRPAVCQLPGVDNNVGGDALEEAIISNTSGRDVQLQLSVELYTGPAPGYLKYVYFDYGAGTMFVNEYDTQSGASYGHAIAAGATSVGAAPWYNTAAWGVPFWSNCRPACLEYFSSAGGVPIFFNAAGNRLRSPQVRQKPEVTGPDGGNSTFFYSVYTATVPGSTEPDAFPNFFGTSAAAPHVAAIAALMMDKQARAKGPKLSPDQITGILESTAKDMRFRAGRTIAPYVFPYGTQGPDFDSGYGFVDAQAALGQVGN